MQIDPTEPHPARRYRAGQNEAAKLNRFRCRSRRLSPPVVAREQDVRSGNSPFFDDFACLFGERCLSTQPGAGERKLPASPQCGGCGRRFCAFGNEVLFVGGQFRSERIVPRLQQVGLGAAIRTWVAANSASVHASRSPRIAGADVESATSSWMPAFRRHVDVIARIPTSSPVCACKAQADPGPLSPCVTTSKVSIPRSAS